MYGQNRSAEWTAAADGRQIAYGLPAGFDVSVFADKEVESVLFSVNTISLELSDNVVITILATLQFLTTAGREPAGIERLPLSESRLVQLPGHRVTRATIDDRATLSLTFDDGSVLRVFEDSPYYESYWIDLGQRHIIV